jgi:hypothetical protein
MSKGTLRLWAQRYSPAKGHYWQAERDVTLETANEWLKVFMKDEPDVIFIVATQKPLNLPATSRTRVRVEV